MTARTRLLWWAEFAALAWLLWPWTAVELLLAVVALHVLAALTPPPKRARVLPSRPQARESDPGPHRGTRA